MQGEDSFQGEDGYEPEIESYDPERLRVRISELEIGDVMAILDNPSNRMQERLSTAWRAMQRQESRTWGVDELIGEMERIYGDDGASAGALEWRLRRSIERNDLFHPAENVPLDEIVGSTPELEVTSTDSDTVNVAHHDWTPEEAVAATESILTEVFDRSLEEITYAEISSSHPDDPLSWADV